MNVMESKPLPLTALDFYLVNLMQTAEVKQVKAEKASPALLFQLCTNIIIARISTEQGPIHVLFVRASSRQKSAFSVVSASTWNVLTLTLHSLLRTLYQAFFSQLKDRFSWSCCGRERLLIAPLLSEHGHTICSPYISIALLLF